MSRADRKSMIGAAMDALELRGRPVKSVRINVDGSVELLTDQSGQPLASNDAEGWADLAGEKEIRGA